MGHHMASHHGNGRAQYWQGIPMIPLPMAMFGMIVSCMFGITIGHMIARKHMTMDSGDYGQMMWKHKMGKGGMGWDKHGMGKGMGMMHHHHGEGPACQCDTWPEPAEAAPDTDLEAEVEL